MRKIKDLVFDRLPRKIEEFDRPLTENEIIVSRLKGVAPLTAEEAIALLDGRPNAARFGRAV